MSQPDAPGDLAVDYEAMREYLAATDVEFAVVFGSHARGSASRSSDVDIAIQFHESKAKGDRFRARNRIDAELQGYSDGFVDVSDIDELPLTVAHAALVDGRLLVGNEDAFTARREQVRQSYESTAAEREREREAFIDRLARGDT